MRVLVSGGAGYIGSHTVVQFVAAGHDVLVVDSFANAKPFVHRCRLPGVLAAQVDGRPTRR